MRLIPTVLGAAILGIGATTAVGAPTLTDAALAPSSWSRTPSASVAWIQNDFGAGLTGPAIVEVTSAADGTANGAWEQRATLAGPLIEGSNGTPTVNVSDLIGRHKVRVVIDGVTNSPFDLGVLQLDRTAPTV